MGLSEPNRFLWNRYTRHKFKYLYQSGTVIIWKIALGQAVNLADSLKKFPQKCMQADRESAYYATYSAKSLQDALNFEFQNGKPILEMVFNIHEFR